MQTAPQFFNYDKEVYWIHTGFQHKNTPLHEWNLSTGSKIHYTSDQLT